MEKILVTYECDVCHTDFVPDKTGLVGYNLSCRQSTSPFDDGLEYISKKADVCFACLKKAVVAYYHGGSVFDFNSGKVKG